MDRPVLCLPLGDIGMNDAEEVLGSAPRPVHPVAGNYERDGLRQRLRDLFSEQLGAADYYAFAHAGFRFVGLCNVGIGNDHVGQLASEGVRPPDQSDWLASQLAGPRTPHAVFSHCLPEPPEFDRIACIKGSSNEYLPFMGENGSRFFQSLLRDRGPLLALAGHQHRPTSGFDVAESQALVLRSCNRNPDEALVSLLLVRGDRDRPVSSPSAHRQAAAYGATLGGRRAAVDSIRWNDYSDVQRVLQGVLMGLYSLFVAAQIVGR